jgi:hypothetical protein
MLTSTATITGTEASRPGLRARVRRVSRSARLAVMLALAAGATLVTTALPASADSINLAYTQPVAGTNCYVTTGTDLNSNAYPGTATEVYCPSWHTVTVTTQLQYVSLAGGYWSLWAQTPTNTYTTSYGTPMIMYYWASCTAGRWQWRVVAYVTVDGVYRGSYANSPHNWTACTTS